MLERDRATCASGRPFGREHRRSCIRQERPPGRGEPDPARQALDQLASELRFERLDLCETPAAIRASAGRPRERARVHDGDPVHELLAQGHLIESGFGIRRDYPGSGSPSGTGNPGRRSVGRHAGDGLQPRQRPRERLGAVHSTEVLGMEKIPTYVFRTTARYRADSSFATALVGYLAERKRGPRLRHIRAGDAGGHGGDLCVCGVVWLAHSLNIPVSPTGDGEPNTISLGLTPVPRGRHGETAARRRADPEYMAVSAY